MQLKNRMNALFGYGDERAEKALFCLRGVCHLLDVPYGVKQADVLRRLTETKPAWAEGLDLPLLLPLLYSEGRTPNSEAEWSPDKLRRVLGADSSVLEAAGKAAAQKAPGSGSDLAALMSAPERHLVVERGRDEKLEAKWSALIQYLRETLPWLSEEEEGLFKEEEEDEQEE